MHVNKCCFIVPLQPATFAILTLDLLYGVIFSAVSIARISVCIATGLLQFILLVLSGAFRSATISYCQETNGWPQDACSSAMTLAYAFLGLAFVGWSISHVYFWFVIQAYSLRMEGRLRYSVLKDRYLQEWDERMEMNGNQLPRSGSVRSAFSNV
ncbi:hypothetical protein DM01DRAFT_313156 [Hesseltinella vesiculosa]|uniref:Uncharacterized protein n=1 Tax=Hesseltinella vesiculosa TaxID=101127 RepID=A0A1X2G9T6_9FUNG|nr:hypothetical protein DM01DRAFT_313156 [Hesseltinella vesiculosa]